MNAKFQVLGLLLLGSVGAASAAPTTPMTGYYPSDISQQQITRAWDTMRMEDLKGDSICSNRATVWNYEMKRRHNIDSKKTFIHFTAAYIHANYDDGKHKSAFRRALEVKMGKKVWYYHVAPSVVSEGETYVMDKKFTEKPVVTAEWADTFIGHLSNKLNDREQRGELLERIHKNINKITKKLRKKGEISESDQQKLDLDRRVLRLISKTPKVDGKYKVECKVIDNIAEHMFDPEAWCHLQDTSMYYWNPRNLNAVNFGSYFPITEEEYTAEAIESGANFIENSFSEESIVQSYKQAFGLDVEFK